MGYNATLMIMLDGISAIDRDLERWWQATTDAIAQKDYKSQQPAANHCNVSQVISVEHADLTQIVAVGGNCGTRLGFALGWNHTKPEDHIRILKELAGSLGYNLVKKRGRE